MKRFDVMKTIQLILYMVLTAAALGIIFMDRELYTMIADDPHVRMLCIILWLFAGFSFAFLFFDFSSYTDLKRENMELDQAVYNDALTGIANRYSVDVYLGQYLNRPLPLNMGCLTIQMTNLAEINEKLGHTGGDEALQAFSDILGSAADGQCFIGRNGGNKFLAIFKDCTDEKLDHFLDTVKRECEKQNAEHPNHAVRYTTGIAFHEETTIHDLTELVALSDQRAYRQFRENQSRNQ